MAKILVSRPKDPKEVLNLILKDPKAANVLTEEMVNDLAQLNQEECHLMFEKTSLGYIVLAAYGVNGETLYELPKDSNDYNEVIFWRYF